jgi:mannitol/fructose-specific phosphotransferase system IIA component
MLIDILKGFKEILGESTELFVGTGGGTPKLNIDSIPGPKPLNKDLLPYYDSNTVYKIENVNSIALSNELNILLNNNIYTITQQIYTIEDYYSSLHNQGVDLTYFRPRYMLELESAYPGVAGKILKIPNLLHELHLKHQRLSINQVMNGIKQANDDQIQMLVEICGNAQEPISLINSAHIFD